MKAEQSISRSRGSSFRRRLRTFAILVALVALAPVQTVCALTANEGVVAVVNDQPITSFDVEQRIKLTAILGSGKQLSRKQALESLIDDVLKRNEIKRLNAKLTDEQIDAAIGKLAKGSNTDLEGLTAKLKNVGISIKALRQQLYTNLAFNRVLSARYKIKTQVDAAAVDRKLDALKNDPRLKPVSIYELQEILLPVDNTSDAMMSQLLVARAIEAKQFAENYKGCASARAAASGIFDVRIGKTVQADPSRLQGPLRAALEKAGPGRLIGPMRGKGGIQMIGFCGRRSIAPQVPTREQVEVLLLNELYDAHEARYLKELRRTAFVDYKNAELSQDQTQ
jgi:peptidyl-prolyl cis-trans isomerase SurA